MPSHFPAELRRRLEAIRLLVLDVDGVLTDGSLLISGDGEARKHFHVADGLAIRLLLEAGIEVAVLSGRTDRAVMARCRELGLRDENMLLGSGDKRAHLRELLGTLGVEAPETAAMGDDLPDIPVLRRVGFAACPCDAAPEVLAVCHHVCGAGGGRGAVREVAELILKAQRRWSEAIRRWTAADPDDEREG
jgi:3-deoxy-D-manno-octulosonate 8-phosphate phosphatase (KDO 8-P phosphatase)